MRINSIRSILKFVFVKFALVLSYRQHSNIVYNIQTLRILMKMNTKQQKDKEVLAAILNVKKYASTLKVYSILNN